MTSTIYRSNGGSSTTSPFSDPWIWRIFALAVAVRAGVLIFNIALDLPPYWGFLPRTSLALAWSHFGQVEPSNLSQMFHVTVKEALESWYLNDRGLVYVFIIFNFLFGHVTYLQVQVLNSTLDAIMVFPVMLIAATLWERRGVRLAGIVYALFIPQIQMAASPDYNPWFSFFLILLTFMVLRLLAAIENQRGTRAVFLLVGLAVTNIVANEFRSVLALFSLGAAGWYWMVSTVHFRKLRLPAPVWKGVAALLLCGVVTLGGATSINFLVRGETSPVRSTLGHNFWTGVGQFANPFGLEDSDASVTKWYNEQTGSTATHSAMGMEYNHWLIKRAEQFIKQDPGLYLSMVARRALHILVPNMAFTLVADLPSYTRQPEQVRLIQMRKDLVAANGWLSSKTISTLVREDPGYVVSLACRVALMLLMPLGLIAAFFVSRRPAAVALACLPLAYLVVCLSPFYATPPIYTSAYASVIPVVAVGWAGLWVWLRRRLGRRRAQPETT